MDQLQMIFTRQTVSNILNSDSEKMKYGAYIIYEPKTKNRFNYHINWF